MGDNCWIQRRPSNRERCRVKYVDRDGNVELWGEEGENNEKTENERRGARTENDARTETERRTRVLVEKWCSSVSFLATILGGEACTHVYFLQGLQWQLPTNLEKGSPAAGRETTAFTAPQRQDIDDSASSAISLFLLPTL